MAADHRTRRQKLQAMANDPGASEGERANARSILAKMGPEPHRPDGSQRAGQKSSYANARRSAWERIVEEMNRGTWEWKPRGWEEELRRAQAQETLRRAGFTMPDDPGFESEYTARAADAQEMFRRQSENIAEAQRRDVDTARLMRDYLEGRASINDLRRHMGMEDV